MIRQVSGIVLLLAAVCAFGQESYQQSGGVRLGYTSGVTYKKFIAGEESVELLLSGRRNGIQLTTMFVAHQPMEFSFNERFYAYLGIGGHIGVESYNNLRKTIIQVNPPEFVYEDAAYFTMGIDGMVGIEYRWLSVPITISFDIKPYFNYIGMRYTNARFWDSGISFKYVF